MSVEESNQLLGWAVASGLKVVSSNHYYTVGGVVYKQRDGAPMGLDTSVDGCDVYMTLWDDKYLKKLAKLKIKIKLYKRYVDDITIVVGAINGGWFYCATNDCMRYDPNHLNKLLGDEKRTFDLLELIGNTIDKNIRLKFDVPSNYIDGRLPILDLKVWMERGNIRFTFYKKTCCKQIYNYEEICPQYEYQEEFTF